MKIPLVDLKTQYLTIKNDIDNAINDVINETSFIKGKYLTKFEKEFAKANNSKFCIGVGNGTDALYIALKALNLGQGDEIITTALSWISTPEAILQCGAKPVFIDINPHTFNIDEKKIESQISSKTKAILPVHLYGQPSEMLKIKEISQKYSLYLIEDCAQAHFSKYNDQIVGTFGEIGTFSFYPGKNLGAFGDGGALITNDISLAEKIRRIANHGSLKKHDHMIAGINSRLDSMQAAILSVKLNHIDDWNNKRLEIAKFYSLFLKDVGDIEIPQISSLAKHIFHIYAIKTIHRNELKTFLQQKGISTGIHYPKALPFLPPFSHLKNSIEIFENAYTATNKILSLPIYPELKQNELEHIINSIKSFFN